MQACHSANVFCLALVFEDIKCNDNDNNNVFFCAPFLQYDTLEEFVAPPPPHTHTHTHTLTHTHFFFFFFGGGGCLVQNPMSASERKGQGLVCLLVS